MEDPFPYGPLVKPDGWVEALSQATAFGDKSTQGDEEADIAEERVGRSLLKTAAFISLIFVVTLGWLLSVWISVGAAACTFVGWLLSQDFGGRAYQRWGPFEDSIIEQLEQRPEQFRWPNADDRRQQIVACVAETVANEKPISEPTCRALHPDDPIQLLFWGPYDDLSPLIFQFEFEKKFDIGVPAVFRRERTFEALIRDSSLLQLVELCEQHLDSFGIKTAVAAKKSRWDNITERIGDAMAWMNLTEGEVVILAVIAVPVVIVVSILVFT